ncbi:porin [Lyticum sinuosum]|uniref:Porin n=1 Tax=Lyticum sinuosum TaxID=1332059 RepID=A0AAE4VLZ7_9RICK|nr:porin [Lyticum sinuosum]MDZ5761143.1 Porin [Lyticum sinuosum]
MKNNIKILTILLSVSITTSMDFLYADSQNTESLNTIDILKDVIITNKTAANKTMSTVANKEPLNVRNTSGVGVEIGGKLDMQYGYNSVDKCFKIDGMSQCGLSSSSYSPKKIGNVTGLGTDTRFSLNIFKRTDSIDIFGAYLEIQADRDTKNVGRQSYIYINSKGGRIEIGNMDGASTNMQVSASTIALGTGGIDGDLRGWNNFKALIVGSNQLADNMFINKPRLPMNCVEKKQNRISYYTPQIYGLTLGFSYAPDPSDSPNKLGSITSVLSNNYYYVDLFDIGAKYERQIMNSVNFSTSLTTQFSRHNTQINTASYNDMFAYEIGAKFDIDAWSFAGSYANQNKSFCLKNETGKKDGNYYTLGTSYKYSDDLAFSLTYFYSLSQANAYQSNIIGVSASNNGENKSKIISIATEYLLVPGMKYYAELNHYNYKSDVVKRTNSSLKVIGNNGYTFLTGLRVQF